MYRRVLLALDLEGVNRVVGEPYSGLVKGCEQWEIARAQAVLEINAAASALFDAGVEKVGLWDNHGSHQNIDRSLVDPRVTVVEEDLSRPRMYFAAGAYDCICYFGYHAMEGTLGGVLAHTMSSAKVQFYRLNGQYIGEIDMDAYIAAAHGIPSCFFAGGNIACAQAERAVPGIVTVATKTELSRNEAVFRDNGALFAEIGEAIVRAVQGEHPICTLAYPATMEKSFKRMEDAAAYLKKLRDRGISAEHPVEERLGRDAHTVVATLGSIEDLIRCI